MDPVRCAYGRRAGPARESQMFFISYGIRTGPVRDPQGCLTAPLRARKGIDTTIICKNPARASYVTVRGPYGPREDPARVVHGLFIISKPVRVPIACNACIKTPRAPYGRARFVRRRTGPARAPWVDVRFLFKTAREQPGNNPYGARECDVTGALVAILRDGFK